MRNTAPYFTVSSRVSRWNLQTFLYRWSADKDVQCAQHFCEILDPHLVARLLILDQVAYPWKGGDIGNGVVITRQPCLVCKVPVHHIQQAAGFIQVALARARVFDFRACKLGEEADLAKHGPDA